MTTHDHQTLGPPTMSGLRVSDLEREAVAARLRDVAMTMPA